MCYKYKTFQKIMLQKTPHTHTSQPLKKETSVIKAKLWTLLNCPTFSAVAFHFPKHLECRDGPDCGLLKMQETTLSSFVIICPFCVWRCMFMRANAANIMWKPAESTVCSCSKREHTDYPIEIFLNCS